MSELEADLDVGIRGWFMLGHSGGLDKHPKFVFRYQIQLLKICVVVMFADFVKNWKSNFEYP